MSIQTTPLPQVLSSGSVISASQSFTAKTSIEVAALLSQADLKIGSKTVTLTIQHSFDGEKTWVDGARAVWTGGLKDKNGLYSPPQIGSDFSKSGKPPGSVRVKIDISDPTNIGATTTIG